MGFPVHYGARVSVLIPTLRRITTLSHQPPPSQISSDNMQSGVDSTVMVGPIGGYEDAKSAGDRLRNRPLRQAENSTLPVQLVIDSSIGSDQ